MRAASEKWCSPQIMAHHEEHHENISTIMISIAIEKLALVGYLATTEHLSAVTRLRWRPFTKVSVDTRFLPRQVTKPGQNG